MLAVCLLGALAAMAYKGCFVRYHNDDYCFAHMIQTHGVVGAQYRWYCDWTGRFSSTFLISIAALSGNQLPYLLLFTVAVWIGATTCLVRHVALAMHAPMQGGAPLLLGALVVYATLEGALGLPQVLYWRTGMLTYAAPLVLFTLYSTVVARTISQRPSSGGGGLAVSTCLAGLSAGCNETWLALQLAVLAIGLAWASCGRHRCRRVLTLFLASGLAASFLAAAMMLLAPGTQARQAALPPHLPISTLVGSLWPVCRGFVVGFIRCNRASVVLSLVVPALVALNAGRSLPHTDTKYDGTRERLVLVLSLLPLFACLLVCCSLLPATYVGTYPDRVFLTPRFALVACLVVWGYLAGSLLGHNQRRTAVVAWTIRSAPAVTIMTLFLCLAPIRAMSRSVADVPDYQKWARAWNRQDQEFRRATLKSLAVVTLWPEGDRVGERLLQLGDGLREDPRWWVNKAVAKYYGLPAVVAREPQSDDHR